MKLLLINGTNREGSRSNLVLKYFESILKSEHETECLNLQNLDLDFFQNPYYNKKTSQILQIETQISQSDCVIFTLPEYLGSFPGISKLFLDSIDSTLFLGKKIAIIGVSSGHSGNLRGIDHFISIMNHLGAKVIPTLPKISLVNNMIQSEEFVPDNRCKMSFEKLRKYIEIY